MNANATEIAELTNTQMVGRGRKPNCKRFKGDTRVYQQWKN